MTAEGTPSTTGEVVAKWRTPLESTATILLGATAFSIIGGIVNAIFTPGASAWRKLDFLGFNVTTIWHVAVLAIAVALVLALRVPFTPDARGAGTARLVLVGAVIVGGVIVLCALLGCIGALGDNEAFVGLSWPEKIGQIMQFLGGAVVAAGVAVLALRARSVVPAPVRAVPQPAAASAAAPPPPATAAAPGTPGWAGDPFGRHQWRYWDGTRWTESVADGSTQSTDPAS